MRIIKFKARREENGLWVTGDFFQDKEEKEVEND